MNPKGLALLSPFLCLVLVVVGAAILAFSLGPVERSEVEISKYLTVKANEYAAQEFGVFPSQYDYVAHFHVMNGSTIKSCRPLTSLYYDEWQRGHYMPNLTDTDDDIFYYRRGIKRGDLVFAFMHTKYFLFFNQDSYDKVIQISVVIYWDEICTTNLAIGATLMATGFFGFGLRTASARLVHSPKANPH